MLTFIAPAVPAPAGGAAALASGWLNLPQRPPLAGVLWAAARAEGEEARPGARDKPGAGGKGRRAPPLVDKLETIVSTPAAPTRRYPKALGDRRGSPERRTSPERRGLQVRSPSPEQRGSPERRGSAKRSSVSQPQQHIRGLSAARPSDQRQDTAGDSITASSVPSPGRSRGSLYDALHRSSRNFAWEECIEIIQSMQQEGLPIDSVAYKALASSFPRPSSSRAGNREAANLMRELLAALDAANIPPDSKLLEIAIMKYAQAEYLAEAQSLLALGKSLGLQLTESMFKEIAIAECRLGRWRAARMLQKEMAETLGTFPDSHYSNAMLMALGRAAEWKNAMYQLQEMRRAKREGAPAQCWPTSSSYGHVITACGRAGEWSRALDILHMMSEDKVAPTLIIFNSAMSACERARQWRPCMELLEKAIAEPGVEPDVITFNTAISALGKGGQMGMALQLLNEMKSHGVLPDRISFNSAMSACARAASPRNDAYRRCLSLKQSMHRMGIRPDKFTYSSAISACAKAHQTSEALSLLEVMQASGEIPDVVTYTSTIDACAATGKWREALRLMEDMETHGVEPNERTFSAAIAAFSKGGQWQRALDTLQQLKEKKLQVGTAAYNAAMTACLHGRQPQRVADLLAEMQTERSCVPDVATYATAIAAAGACGEWKTALELLEEMRNGGPSLRPNVFAFTAAIGAVGRGGQWQRALALLDEMTTQGLDPDTPAYNAVIHACILSGRVDEALQVLERMEAAGHNLDIATVTDLHAALSKCGRVEEAGRLYKEAVQSGVLPSSDLDGEWEVDVSLLPPQLARAKVFATLERLCTALKGGTAVQQLVFVCGTGVQRSEHGTATRRFDMRSHVRQVLLEAGLKSNEPSGKKESNPMYEGCVVVGKERVGDWAKSSIV